MVDWPESLSAEEKEEQWMELYVKGPDFGNEGGPETPPLMLRQALPWGIDFNAYTPLKLR